MQMLFPCATVISHNENIFAIYHKTITKVWHDLFSAFQSDLKLKTKKKKRKYTHIVRKNLSFLPNVDQSTSSKKKTLSNYIVIKIQKQNY